MPPLWPRLKIFIISDLFRPGLLLPWDPEWPVAVPPPPPSVRPLAIHTPLSHLLQLPALLKVATRPELLEAELGPLTHEVVHTVHGHKLQAFSRALLGLLQQIVFRPGDSLGRKHVLCWYIYGLINATLIQNH